MITGTYDTNEKSKNSYLFLCITYKKFSMKKQMYYIMIHYLCFQMSDEDKHDELCADFSDVNKQILNVRQRIESMTEEVSSKARQAEKSKGKGQRSEALTSASEQLSELRSELTRLEMERKQITDKLEQLQ